MVISELCTWYLHVHGISLFFIYLYTTATNNNYVMHSEHSYIIIYCNVIITQKTLNAVLKRK